MGLVKRPHYDMSDNPQIPGPTEPEYTPPQSAPSAPPGQPFSQPTNNFQNPPGYGTTFAVTQEEKTFAMLSWFLPIVVGFIGPLIFFLISNDKPFAKRHAAMSLGLQLFVTVSMIVSFFLVFLIIGFILMPLVGVFGLVITIIGGIAASKGENYEVPIVGPMIAKMFGV